MNIIFLIFAVIAIVSCQDANFCNAGSCSSSGDCLNSMEMCCEGTCVLYYGASPTAAEGEKCLCLQCGVGLTCNSQGICEAVPDFPKNCGDCSSSLECYQGTCIGGKCKQAPFAEGEPCFDTDACEDGLGCVDRVCTAHTAELDGLCYNIANDCGGDLVCDMEARTTCQSIIGSPEGEYCSSTEDCEDGLICGSNAMCKQKIANGEVCTSDSSCTSGWCVDPAMTCMALLENEEICTSASQCASNVCLRRGPVSICTDLRQENQDCQSTSQCDTGLKCSDTICISLLENDEFCEISDDCLSYYCAAEDFGVCEPLLSEGTVTTDASLCASGFIAYDFSIFQYVCKNKTAVGFYCPSNIYCETNYCKNSVCREFALVNETCNNNNDCASGICTNIGGGNRICTENPNLAAGVNCNLDIECQSRDCSGGSCVDFADDGSFCNFDENCINQCRGNTCGVYPDIGGDCKQYCNEGYCLREDICRDRLAEGEDCSEYACVAELSCFDLDSGSVCSSLRAVGEECSRDRHCETDWCDQNVCAALLAQGENCNNNGECLSGYCPFTFGNRVCEDLLDIGQSCSQRADCLSNICLDFGNGTVCAIPQDDGESCTRDSDCIHYCDTNPFSSDYQTCVTLELGDSCSQDLDCGDDGFCYLGVCSTPRIIYAEGDDCSDSIAGYCDTSVPLICRTETSKGECAEPNAEDGEKCESGQCVEGFYCNANVCKAVYTPIGDTCSNCEFRCNFLDFVCAEYIAPGATCTSNDDCEFFCGSDNKCSDDWLNLGDDCDASFDCGENANCLNQGVCVVRTDTVVTLKKLDEKCSFTGDCEAGLFCDTTLNVAVCAQLQVESIPDLQAEQENRLYCQSRIAVGGVCISTESVATGRGCVNSLQCPRDNTCTTNSLGNRVCVATNSLGEDDACIYDSQCLQDLSCTDNICSPLDRAEGDACADFLSYEDDLFCTCKDKKLQLIQLDDDLDENNLLRTYIRQCKDSNIKNLLLGGSPLTSIAQEIKFDVTVHEDEYKKNQDFDWKDCHKSAMHIVCNELCPSFLQGWSSAVSTTLVYNLGITEGATVNCKDRTVKIEADVCPYINVINCDALSPRWNALIDAVDEFVEFPSSSPALIFNMILIAIVALW